MVRNFLVRACREDTAAISSLYAISILPLVMMAGVGFDYGRMMGLDTELQNAADQAALAAATQLDGSLDAITNAQTAAADALGNQARFANDGQGRAIPSAGLTFVFYRDYVGDAQVGETTDPEVAKVVEVTVETRTVRYALTPVMAALRGDVAIGRATAGLQAATCNVAPMFFCIPHDGADMPIANFPRPQDSGRGLKLHLRNNQSETFTPGNFGFLDTDWDSSPPNRELGLNSSSAGCFTAKPDEETEPGSRTPMGASLNSRFDVFNAPMNPNDCDPLTGDYCPSANVTKDWINVQTKNNNQPQVCSSNPTGGANDWKRYSDVTDVALTNPGYSDDSSFTGILGSGQWNFESWKSQYSVLVTGQESVPDLNGDNLTSRYEAFKWALSDAPNRLQPRLLGTSPGPGNNRTTLYCSYPQPVRAPAYPATDTQKDRRILTVGAVDCSQNPPNGRDDVRILRWVDLFLVRPINQGSETEYLTEVIGPAEKPNGDSGFQYFGRRKAVLLR